MANRSSSRVWLVTGCSSGFGSLLVPAILARGDRVIATARRPSALVDLEPHHNLTTMELDVTSPQPILDNAVGNIIGKFGQIDVLVNNAGYVAPGVWEEMSHEETTAQFNTNFFGALNLTRAVLPTMRAKKSGTLVFMSSIAAWHGVGAGGPYSSSKFALEGAVECLEKETSHLGIETFLMVLGQFRTDILNAARQQNKKQNPIPDYDQVSAELRCRHQETSGKQPGDPKLAAERILDVVRREGPLKGFPRLPLRIPLGSDAVQVMQAKCEETLRILQSLGDIARTTDYPDADEIPTYLR